MIVMTTLRNELIQDWAFFRQGFSAGSLHTHPIQTIITIIIMMGLLGSFMGLCAGIAHYISDKRRIRRSKANIIQSEWNRVREMASDAYSAGKWAAEQAAFLHESYEKLTEENKRLSDLVQAATNRIGIQDAQIVQLNERLGEEAENVSTLSEVLSDAIASMKPKKSKPASK